jgi:AcrR family transcriptional regulator
MYGAVGRALATVKTVAYGGMSQGTSMTDQLSAQDWLKQGLRTLAKEGFTALKAEPLAKVMGVSRGSFYWHFADIGAFHAAILDHWREVAAEQIIANLEAASDHDNPLPLLLRQAFGARLALENAVRTWATLDPLARTAVQAIDRRRLDYVENLLRASGLSTNVARARAQILYWAFLGYALSDKPLPRARQQAVLDELVRIASP